MEGYDSAYDNKAIFRRLEVLWTALGGERAVDFTRMTGIKSQSISNYKAGRRRVSLEKAVEICRATGATLDYIYFGDISCLPEYLQTRVRRILQQARQDRPS